MTEARQVSQDITRIGIRTQFPEDGSKEFAWDADAASPIRCVTDTLWVAYWHRRGHPEGFMPSTLHMLPDRYARYRVRLLGGILLDIDAPLYTLPYDPDTGEVWVRFERVQAEREAAEVTR